MRILFTGENLRALRFKSSYAFLKRPPDTLDFDTAGQAQTWSNISHVISG